MTEKPQKRVYRMSLRAASAAQTEHDIFNATATLWNEMPLNEITLDLVAERAGVSVRTVIRRYGSKESLFEACIQNRVANTEMQRDNAITGDIESAIDSLLSDYEAYGDAMIKTQSSEEQLPEARKIVQAGRRYHREWCARVFAPFLPGKADPDYKLALSAFYAATDIYHWKLLRQDLRHSRKDTRAIFVRLVQGLTGKK